jgi:hypothetical protein
MQTDDKRVLHAPSTGGLLPPKRHTEGNSAHPFHREGEYPNTCDYCHEQQCEQSASTHA